MKQIPLTQGQFAIVDDEDYKWLSQFKWHAAKRGKNFYATRHLVKEKRKIYMHQQVMNTQQGQELDHKNGNGLDNRKENLRFCTRSQNNMNRRKTKGSSKYKGVSWDNQSKKWVAHFQFNGKSAHIGYFDSEIEAACAYDETAKRYFGEYALLNFRKVI